MDYITHYTTQLDRLKQENKENFLIKNDAVESKQGTTTKSMKKESQKSGFLF